MFFLAAERLIKRVHTTSAKQQAVYFADTNSKPIVKYKVAIISSLTLKCFWFLYCFLTLEEAPNKDDFWFKVGAMTIYMTSLFLT